MFRRVVVGKMTRDFWYFDALGRKETEMISVVSLVSLGTAGKSEMPHFPGRLFTKQVGCVFLNARKCCSFRKCGRCENKTEDR